MSVHHPHPLSCDELLACDALFAELTAEDDVAFDGLVRAALAEDEPVHGLAA